MKTENFEIGFLKSASISDGFIIRLYKNIPIEENLRIGDFLVVDGRIFKFYGIIDDLMISSSSDDVFLDPPQTDFQKMALNGTYLYSEAVLSPYIMLDRTTGKTNSIKTLPPHFSLVTRASKEDIEAIFMQGAKPFFIGTPLTMKEQIYVDLEKLCMRNNGIFGITGSGKTFLAKIIFSGIIKHKASSLLIFDMHNEYGFQSRDESGQSKPSLKHFFGNRIKVFDVNVSNKEADSSIIIPYKYIQPEDLEAVSRELDFSEKSLETAYLVRNRKGEKWLSFLESLKGKGEESVSGIAQELGVNASALSALVRHLEKLFDLNFIRDVEDENSIMEILSFIKSKGSVVVQFTGKYSSSRLAYFLVSGIITKRIHEHFEKMTQEELRENRLVIVIEEAHKFLSTGIKEKNAFGVIAREMRKFNVTLFIIDQRPSEIDSEVLSQIGTRFTLQLLDEKDIDAVFQGVGGGSGLKKILRSIQQREVLVFGFAMPMPVAIKVREFGEDFFNEVSLKSIESNLEKDIKDIYG